MKAMKYIVPFLFYALSITLAYTLPEGWFKMWLVCFSLLIARDIEKIVLKNGKL